MKTTATQITRDITLTLHVCEDGDLTGRLLYSSARSVESAIAETVDRCVRHGYAFAGHTYICAYEGEHPTLVNATRLGEYYIAMDHGKIVSVEKR